MKYSLHKLAQLAQNRINGFEHFLHLVKLNAARNTFSSKLKSHVIPKLYYF